DDAIAGAERAQPILLGLQPGLAVRAASIRPMLTPLRLERIENSDAGPGKVRHVARDDREAMFPRGRRGCGVEGLVAGLCRQAPPAPRDANRHRQDALAINTQRDVKPALELLRKSGIGFALTLDAELDLGDRDAAQKQIGRASRAQPSDYIRVAFA